MWLNDWIDFVRLFASLRLLLIHLWSGRFITGLQFCERVSHNISLCWEQTEICACGRLPFTISYSFHSGVYCQSCLCVLVIWMVSHSESSQNDFIDRLSWHFRKSPLEQWLVCAPVLHTERVSCIPPSFFFLFYGTELKKKENIDIITLKSFKTYTISLRPFI